MTVISGQGYYSIFVILIFNLIYTKMIFFALGWIMLGALIHWDSEQQTNAQELTQCRKARLGCWQAGVSLCWGFLCKHCVIFYRLFPIGLSGLFKATDTTKHRRRKSIKGLKKEDWEFNKRQEKLSGYANSPLLYQMNQCSLHYNSANSSSFSTMVL